MSALSPRVGEILSLRGTVRTVEQIAPAGHLRITLDVAPPKPEEPTGLGAVVEDADGRQWVRCGSDEFPWTTDEGNLWGTYADSNAVRVLSEGAQS